ncbi:hypothetical protein CFK37_15645 [Virgibacillus phasianinus]|uniref:DUF503 domain-containing protein n=1 Tax=Virgibacillus phasianinus TaxID=2017483 RepID=A0A220U5A4_9BACI|nr:DUF503 domain-containing protein [Virgibacillus phasianinus]ASK63484.1 hypothetical protein CFK37_15645 [Virgibacillus phasianinus]
MIVVAEVECMLYDTHSLKDKRSVLKKIMNKLSKDFNIAITELDFHDLWQRTKFGIVTISTSYTHAEQVIQEVLKNMDNFPELECTITQVERI